MTTPHVSVVVPSYNHGRFVEEAVTSVLSQDLDDLELIVVDDGSSDDSLERLESISDSRLRLVPQENRGAHAALNRGLDMARGRRLAILNSDDRWAPSRLSQAVAVLEQEPEIALVGSWVEVIDEEGHPQSVKQGYENLDPWPVPDPAATFKADGDLRTALLHQNYWATTSNFVFPSSTWREHRPFRPLRYAHDWDFALRVQEASEARLIEAPLLGYRVHPSNTIRENRAGMIYEICWVLAAHLPRYVAKSSFWDAGEARRVEQLLHSLHVYGCDKVLWAMMAHLHHGPPGADVRLLEDEDPARRAYADAIVRMLGDQPPGADPPHPAQAQPSEGPTRGFRGWLKSRLGT